MVCEEERSRLASKATESDKGLVIHRYIPQLKKLQWADSGGLIRPRECLRWAWLALSAHATKAHFARLYSYHPAYRPQLTKSFKWTGITWFLFFVLRFYGPVNPMGSCRARSVYLGTRYVGITVSLDMLVFKCPVDNTSAILGQWERDSVNIAQAWE